MRPLMLLLLAACAADADGDGFEKEFDCDDGDAEVNPEATEVCDGVDNNCDGAVDEPEAIDAETWWVDLDDDGYGDPNLFAKACEEPQGWADNGDDCDDDDDQVGPCR